MPKIYPALAVLLALSSPAAAITTIGGDPDSAIPVEFDPLAVEDVIASLRTDAMILGLAGDHLPDAAPTAGLPAPTTPPNFVSSGVADVRPRPDTPARTARAFGADAWAAMIIGVGILGAVMRRLRLLYGFRRSRRPYARGLSRSDGRSRRSSARRRR